MKLFGNVTLFNNEADAITAKKMAFDMVWMGHYKTPCFSQVKDSLWVGPSDAMMSYHHITRATVATSDADNGCITGKKRAKTASDKREQKQCHG
jgi:hypothetical protein